MKKHYVGLDVAMKETVLCIIDETGKIVHRGRSKTDPKAISDHLQKVGLLIEKVGLESGSLSHWLTEGLVENKVPAICIDARKMAAFLAVQTNKTDDNDAKGIADAMRGGFYSEVAPKTQESLEIGTLLKARHTLVEQRVQLTNTIRGLLKIYGIRLGPVGKKKFVKTVQEQLSDKYLIAWEGINTLLRTFETVQQEIETLSKRIEKIAEEDEVVKNLMTVPGVGPIVALSFRGEVGDPKRFKKSRTVGAFFGLTPKEHSSGEIKKQGRISKRGSTAVRSLLAEAGVVLLTRSKKWSKLKAWGLKIWRKNGLKKASTAVGRKLAVIMHRMMITKTEFVYGEEKKKAA